MSTSTASLANCKIEIKNVNTKQPYNIIYRYIDIASNTKIAVLVVANYKKHASTMSARSSHFAALRAL